jgi:hypothetical protein
MPGTALTRTSSCARVVLGAALLLSPCATEPALDTTTTPDCVADDEYSPRAPRIPVGGAVS